MKLKENEKSRIDEPIIPAATAIETFRDSGYKNTASALAELIDNSIEANAADIQILTFEESVTLAHRTVQQVKKIAVYDNGDGMTPETLKVTLQFGMGTRLRSRKGMGRFGIGLPNASISQCKLVEVYSWQNGRCYSTYLDVDEIRESKQQNSNPVSERELPTDILNELEGDFDKKSGTLVVWSKCDRLDIKRSKALFNTMEVDLCRNYRHFLDNDNSYGNKVDIRLIVCGRDRSVHQLKPNDPLYLLTPNNVPGYEDKATNELHGSVIEIPVPYGEQGETSVVEMRFSIALPEIQRNEGGTGKIGQKHYQRNTGISVVRSCREIDFGDFSFFNPREYRERWWGCEIRFDPVLDELFGVTNNKQSVRGLKYLDVNIFEKEHGEKFDEELKHNRRLYLLYHISKHFKNNHDTLMDTIVHRHKGSKGSTTPDEPSDRSSNIANEELKTSKVKTKSKIEGESKSEEEKRKEWLIELGKSHEELDDEKLKQLADLKMQLKLDFDFGTWPGEQFFTIETRGETTVLVINKKHPFYEELYEPLCENEDTMYSDAIDLMLMAYAYTEDELYRYEDELSEVRSKWGGYVLKFLKALKGSA